MSIPGLLRSLVLFILFFIVFVVLALTYLATRDRAVSYPVSLEGIDLPQFDHQVIDFIPTFDKLRTLPFTAGAVVDIDGDGVEELFLGGGIDQQDAIFRFENGEFVDITASTNWQKDTPDKTFSAVSLDLDRDGDNDLLVTRQSGVFLYRNEAARFTVNKLDLELDSESVPLSVAIGDVNRDGLYDLYASGYIAREFVQGETIFNLTYGGVSALLLNQGDDIFSNETEAAGLLYQHNTFQSVFMDVDNDDDVDLVVAHDTGQVRTWRNRGDGTFENSQNPTSDVFAYPMGIAVTDLGNDGLPDFFFSNVGTTPPAALVRGDLRENQVLNPDWILLENKGNFEFEDSAEARQVADYEFSWGAIFEDFNLDGRDDLVVSENYEGWPLHKLPAWRLDGRFLMQDENGVFMAAGKEIGVSNREYGISPLTADFNQDGYPDLIHVNLLGPQNVYLSRGGGNGFLKVQLPNTVDSVGAEVTVTLDDGSVLVQSFVVGEGLVSDQSHVLIFGLGPDASATKVQVDPLNGEDVELNGTFRDELLLVELGG